MFRRVDIDCGVFWDQLHNRVAWLTSRWVTRTNNINAPSAVPASSETAGAACFRFRTCLDWLGREVGGQPGRDSALVHRPHPSQVTYRVKRARQGSTSILDVMWTTLLRLHKWVNWVGSGGKERGVCLCDHLYLSGKQANYHLNVCHVTPPH